MTQNIAIMISIGDAVDHGSTEPVEEFLKRELLNKTNADTV